jgi:hypothetical protein
MGSPQSGQFARSGWGKHIPGFIDEEELPIAGKSTLSHCNGFRLMKRKAFDWSSR